MTTPKLTSQNRLALLMHEAVTNYHGKMGFGLMRYGVAPTVVVIDHSHAGESLQALTGIPCNAPIVATLEEAMEFSPDTLIPAVAPPGGAIPADWWEEIRFGVSHGLNLVNGLHAPLANHPDLTPLPSPNQWIWDIRQEPSGLGNGSGEARHLPARRVLFVGTDMANGKMTAALEMDRAARTLGMRSRFLATGQIGIAIAGEGIPLDAIRIDFATGSVEQMVMKYGHSHDILFIEGQGSILHPASTASFALMRGAIPTHLILTHRVDQETILRCPWVKIPPLSEVVKLYEQIASACGSLPSTKVAGIALNTGHLSELAAACAIQEVESETGLPAADVLRGNGAAKLVEAVKNSRP